MADLPKVHTYDAKFMVLPRDHVHAYVVELENKCVVVDGGLAMSSAAELRQLAESTGKPIACLLMTHGHPDHYTGLVKFADVPRYASQGGLDFAKREDVAKASTAKGYLGDDYPDERVFPDRIISDGDTVTVDGVTFTFTDLGPGESDSDGMWSFEANGVKHHFVGDAIAYQAHSFFRDGHAAEWLAILDRLENELGPDDKVYIGHGPTPAPREAIGWLRGYIQTFLAAVNDIEDKTPPISRDRQEQVIAAMKEYFPEDTTLFLLDYEMGETMENYYRKTGQVA